jgi:hypothetical protein
MGYEGEGELEGNDFSDVISSYPFYTLPVIPPNQKTPHYFRAYHAGRPFFEIFQAGLCHCCG